MYLRMFKEKICIGLSLLNAAVKIENYLESLGYSSNMKKKKQVKKVRSRLFEVCKKTVISPSLICSNCLKIIKRIDPQLIQEYIGAAKAATSRNPDRARHTFISLRTLWEQILTRLAPPDSSLKWLQKTNRVSAEYIYIKAEKRCPTKFGRLLFIFREVIADEDKLYSPLVKGLKAYLEKLNEVHKHLLKSSKLKRFFKLGNTHLNTLEPVVIK
ncbi:MAG: hypothetical protein ACERJ1_08530 [Halodesulfovibrio sp.]|uniref:pPIWI-associating nuclease domain-containing protein n=1 Tax=Halodesulfovibrio sp. TaxID=1912772 RepID=UPI00359DC08D